MDSESGREEIPSERRTFYQNEVASIDATRMGRVSDVKKDKRNKQVRI